MRFAFSAHHAGSAVNSAVRLRVRISVNRSAIHLSSSDSVTLRLTISSTSRSGLSILPLPTYRNQRRSDFRQAAGYSRLGVRTTKPYWAKWRSNVKGREIPSRFMTANRHVRHVLVDLRNHSRIEGRIGKWKRRGVRLLQGDAVSQGGNPSSDLMWPGGDGPRPFRNATQFIVGRRAERVVRVTCASRSVLRFAHARPEATLSRPIRVAVSRPSPRGAQSCLLPERGSNS